MSAYEYVKTKYNYNDNILMVRRKNQNYEQWSQRRGEWYFHIDAMGAFVGFTDYQWERITEEEAFALMKKHPKPATNPYCLERAVRVATEAHQGQLDKGGKPYIEHPMHVAEQMQTDDEKIVALLHDVVEDTDVTIYDLMEQSFGIQIIEAIKCLIKDDGETYDAYIARVKANDLARAVKIADIKHNMDLSRLHSISEEDLQRVKKYEEALKSLSKP